MNILQIGVGFYTLLLCARQKKIDQLDSPQASQKNCKWKISMSLTKQRDPQTDSQTVYETRMFERTLYTPWYI